MAKINRNSYCAGKRGTSFEQKKECHEKKKDECTAASKLCYFVGEKPIKDVGAPGRTPPEKRWSPGIELKEGSLKKYFDDQTMVGHVNLAGCERAGGRMKSDGIPEKKAMSKINYALNIAPSGTYSSRDHDACIKGIQKAFGRE